MKIENDVDVAKFFWGEGGLIPQIDELNRIIREISNNKKSGGCYSICPIRFSIGAIFFERKMLEEANWFHVKRGKWMGLD